MVPLRMGKPAASLVDPIAGTVLAPGDKDKLGLAPEGERSTETCPISRVSKLLESSS